MDPRATVYNESSLERTHWGAIPFPRHQVDTFDDECTFLCDDGRRFRAVAGRRQGMNGRVFRIAADLNGHEMVDGELINERYKGAGDFYAHPWVSDDIAGLVPAAGAMHENQAAWTENMKVLKMTDSSAAHQRWFIRRSLPQFGLIFEAWADILSGTPVIDWFGKIVWSDRNDERYDRIFQFIGLKAGEYIDLDFAQRFGIAEPARTPQKEWMHVLASNIGFTDGSAIPLSGRMLSFIGPNVEDQVDADVDPEDMGNPIARSLRALYAGAEGGVLGVAHGWDGHWLANKNVPRLSQSALRELGQRDLDRFHDHIQQIGDIYSPRPLGTSTQPGATGDQEDFAATKGTYCVSGHDPRHIRALQFSAYADCFRGFMHYEDEKPLDLSRHPDWVTWSGTTHWHTGVSPDRLGKQSDGWRPRAATGWSGYDDQHRSQNTLAALMGLTDDPLAYDIMRHHLTVDLAAVRVRHPQNGAGSGRAQGRVAGAFAHLLTLADGDDRAKLDTLLQVRMTASATNPLITNANAAVRILAVNGADGRKDVRDAQGNLIPTWSVWEHGLSAVGMYNAWKAKGDPQILSTLQTFLRTVVNEALFQEAGAWYLCDDMGWYGGNPAPNPPSLSSPHHIVDPGLTGTTGWAFFAILIAAEVLDPQSAEVAKAKQAIEWFTNSAQPDDRRIAEWWCCVKEEVIAGA